MHAPETLPHGDPKPTGDRMVYWVPSRTTPGRNYRVDATANAGAMHCSCPSFARTCQPNLDRGVQKFTRRERDEKSGAETLCVHCEDLIFYFCRELYGDMAKSEMKAPPKAAKEPAPEDSTDDPNPF